MYVIHANLDAEARWAGGSLPAAIATRVSYYAALLSVLAPPDAEVEVWAPAAIDASRLLASPAWRPPTMRVGAPPRADLVWANPEAKAANDRRLAHAIARELECALPGSTLVETIDELRIDGAWVAKAPWTTAGRDRCHGTGAPTGEQRTRLSRLLGKFGALVVEPWVERILDVGVCARIVEDEGEARVAIEEPHGLVTDARGTFLGIDLASSPASDALSPPSHASDGRRRALAAAEHATLVATAVHVGARLAMMGFRGAFAIDAFVHRDARGERRLHPLCEINARTTFGHVARALALRGASRLGFGAAPADATVLVAPAGDGITAWIA